MRNTDMGVQFKLRPGPLITQPPLSLNIQQFEASVGALLFERDNQMLPPLTTVRTLLERIGTAAAKLLLALMRGKSTPLNCIDLGYEVVVRHST